MNTIYDYMNWYGIQVSHDSGKEIARWKGVYTHTGIIVGVNRHGTRMVIHNHPDTGPALVTLSDFCNGKDYWYTNTAHESWDVVALRAFRQLGNGKGYSPVSYNCQDLSSYARTGSSNSHGRNNTFGLLLAALIIGIAAK